jgi:Tol biopolymer transport system component
MQVWVCDSDGTNSIQLTSFPEPGAALPSWSPDGRYLAFGSAARGNHDIYVIRAEGAAPLRLTAESSEDVSPSWSRDGRWIYFVSNRSRNFEVWKVPVEGGTAVRVTKNGGHKPVESHDGKFVYFERSASLYDAWRVPVEGGEEMPILQNLRSRWALVENGIYLFELEHSGEMRGTWCLVFFNFATGRSTRVTALGGPPILGQTPTVSPNGKTILYTQLDTGEADLMLMENFH